MNIFSVMKEHFENSPAKSASFISLAMALLIVLTSFFSEKSNSEIQNPQEETPFFSDLIPDGYSLVPVEILNGDTLAHLMDLSAYVDLYSLDPLRNQKQLLFKRIKIIKNSGETPSFSVLLPDDKNHNLQALHSPVFAVLKSKKEPKTSHSKKPKASHHKKMLPTFTGDEI
jgi:hypothetical protein